MNNKTGFFHRDRLCVFCRYVLDRLYRGSDKKPGLFLCLALIVDVAFAVQVPDLYTVEIPIESQQTEQRLLAAKKGLGDVIVRVSGSRNALSNERISQALGDPDNFLKQFNFLTRKRVDQEGSEIEVQMVRLNFDPALINNLLRQSGLPIWGVNRPNLLLWLVQEQDGNRSIISAGDDSGLKQAIEDQASVRGLPTLFPLMDLEDNVALSTTDAWGLFQERLEQASRRYNSEAILAGKVYFNEQAEWTGRWLFIFRGETLSFNVHTKRLEDFPVDTINRVADYLASYYAVSTDAQQKGTVNLLIKGIRSTQDYALAGTYMEKFAAVRDVFVTRVEGDLLYMDLVTEGQPGKLKEAIALDNKLVPEPPLLGEDGREILVFRWRP